MSKYKIEVYPENCTGCLRCQLACSELYTKAFSPFEARIRVDTSGLRYLITFTPECNECGVCVDECFYGALSKDIREKSK